MYIDWEGKLVKVYDDNNFLRSSFWTTDSVDIERAVLQGDTIVVTTKYNVFVYKRNGDYSFALNSTRPR